MLAISTLLTLASFSLGALGKTYYHSVSYRGKGFLDAFNHEAIKDPTNGRVNYVDQATAIAQNLTYWSDDDDHFIIRGDYKTKLTANGPGRSSVRLRSKQQYTEHVTVFNIRHMPTGCGTWPAIWQMGDRWPEDGEIDILEGVNDMSPNQATLHTTAGCTMPDWRPQRGVITQNDCDWKVNYNTGCGVKSSTLKSYGPAFNLIGGGWYVMERTESFIKVWFFPRDSPLISDDVKNGASSIDTDELGLPFAYFPNDSCDFDKYFHAHETIINLTFCGDWAGSNAYNQAGCPGNCVDYVNNNPAAFREAYFDFQWLKIYT